jgi:4-hydroxyphenylacetate 3-monooxygenase
MSIKAEDVIQGRARPFTGPEYLESLRDGREVWIYGERVDDVTTHPAFRNAARSIARLYDALHDPAQKDVLTCPTDTGSGGFTHRFFRVARSREDLIGQREAIAHWARMTYGWMGRTPDYKASLMNTLGANSAIYGRFAENAKA